MLYLKIFPTIKDSFVLGDNDFFLICRHESVAAPIPDDKTMDFIVTMVTTKNDLMIFFVSSSANEV